MCVGVRDVLTSPDASFDHVVRFKSTVIYSSLHTNFRTHCVYSKDSASSIRRVVFPRSVLFRRGLNE
jgi:hypothetical protein